MLSRCNSSQSDGNYASGEGARGGASDVDRLSALPDHIIECVTSRLTLRDAARMKVLSSRWKHIAVSSRRKLLFDWENMFQAKNYPYWLYWDEDRCADYKIRFVKSVNQFIESFEPSSSWSLEWFGICFCLSCDYQDDVDKWVRFALKNGAKVIALNLHCSLIWIDPNYYLEYDHYFFSSSYGFGSKLPQGSKVGPRTLLLENCRLMPTVYQGVFSNLAHLHFCYTNLADHDLSFMFSCLKKLKILYIRHCPLPEAMTLGSLALLEVFSLLYSCGLREISVSNVKLVRFECIMVVPPEIRILGGVPNIKEFIFVACEASLCYLLICLPKDMPNLSCLELYASDDLWCRRVFSERITYGPVTYLKLVLNHLYKLIRVFRSFPRLRKLTVVLKASVIDSIFGIFGGKHIYPYLEEVEYYGFYGGLDEVDLLIHFLNNAPSLKKLIIISKLDDEIAYYFHVQQDDGWDLKPKRRQKIFRKLQPFARDVKIIFK